MGCVLFQQPVGLIPQWSSWLFLKEVHILTWVPHYALHLLCLEYLPFRVWHNFLSPFISESCSHIAQSESYFTHQTTHLPSVAPPPCSAPHPHSVHYYLKEWIISREKSIVGTERMIHGRNKGGKHLRPKVWLMRSFCFDVQRARLTCGTTNSPSSRIKIENKQE